MADGGELAAVFKALASDAAQAGEDIGSSIARLMEKTADIGKENVDRILAADAENAKAISVIRPKAPDDLTGSGAGNLAAGGGGGSGRIARLLGDGHEYQYNMVENPGPLAEMDGTPAANFAGGRYDEVALGQDTTLYRGGDSDRALGQWFTREKPQSVAQVRIDTAVKPQWIDPQTGVMAGASPVDTVYEVKIPAGTKVYPGPTGYQGGVYVGGAEQIFVPKPWRIPGVQVTGSEPLK